MRHQPKLYLIFAVLSTIYLLSQFFRGSNAVIAPDLIRELDLDAESLGILGGAFFYSFALLQIPMGPMLDRIGPRRVMAFSSLIAGMGSLVFGWGESFIAVFCGRVLIGAGMACILMGAMKVFVLKFSPDRFASLVGFYFSIGTVGNVLSGSPLAYVASSIGWRRAFNIAGGLTILLAFLVYWVLGGEKKREESLPSSSSEPAIGLLSSVRLVLGSLAFWQIGTVAFFRYGTFISLQGLWLGPYLMDIKGYSPVQAGNMLVFLAIGIFVGAPVGGRLSDLKSPKIVSLAGFGLYLLTLFLLIGISKTLNPYWYGSILFLMGFSSALSMMIFSHAKELFPVTISATVLAGVNFFSMVGGALLMSALGRVIECFPRTNHTYPAEAYHFAFLICFLGMGASAIFYAFSPSKPRSELGVQSSESLS